jgi:hypothetical protein
LHSEPPGRSPVAVGYLRGGMPSRGAWLCARSGGRPRARMRRPRPPTATPPRDEPSTRTYASNRPAHRAIAPAPQRIECEAIAMFTHPTPASPRSPSARLPHAMAHRRMPPRAISLGSSAVRASCAARESRGKPRHALPIGSARTAQSPRHLAACTPRTPGRIVLRVAKPAKPAANRGMPCRLAQAPATIAAAACGLPYRLFHPTHRDRRGILRSALPLGSRATSRFRWHSVACPIDWFSRLTAIPVAFRCLPCRLPVWPSPVAVLHRTPLRLPSVSSVSSL